MRPALEGDGEVISCIRFWNLVLSGPARSSGSVPVSTLHNRVFSSLARRKGFSRFDSCRRFFVVFFKLFPLRSGTKSIRRCSGSGALTQHSSPPTTPPASTPPPSPSTLFLSFFFFFSFFFLFFLSFFSFFLFSFFLLLLSGPPVCGFVLECSK